MFPRFHQTPSRLQVSLRESRRIGGKPRCEHIASLGSIPLPMTDGGRIAFWDKLNQRLAMLSNRISAEARDRIISAIDARIPVFTPDELHAFQRENIEADGKLWGDLRDLSASQAAALKEHAAMILQEAASHEACAAATAKCATNAKEKVDRLAKGETVGGGLKRELTREEMIRIIGGPAKARYCENVHQISEALGFETFLQNLTKEHETAERRFIRSTARRLKRDKAIEALRKSDDPYHKKLVMGFDRLAEIKACRPQSQEPRVR